MGKFAPLVDLLAEDIRPYLDVPFAFFGHSMGALIAFELARKIRRDAERLLVHLFVSGHPAPHLPRRAPVLHRLPDSALVDELRRLGATPEAVLTDPQMLALVLPVVRADFAVCETYEYEDGLPLTCPISVFGGLHDPWVTSHELAGWQEHSRAAVTVRLFPGDHFFLDSARPLVLRTLSTDLRAHVVA